MTNLIINRDYIEQNYLDILKNGLSDKQLQYYIKNSKFDDSVIVQESSGSSKGKPLLIPRSSVDIQNIYMRTLRAYLSHYKSPPKRIAMVGGVSHFQVAKNFEIQGTQFCSFDISDEEKLMAYSPDVLSCYPSIAREIVHHPKWIFPDLKCFKLGGETLLQIDLENINKKFPNIIVVEQLGSTEMPGMGFGVYTDFKLNGIVPELDRYSFRLTDSDDWQDLSVKDNFKNLLFPIGEFYNQGDEVIFNENRIKAIRRKDHPQNKYLDMITHLFKEGFEQIQIDLKESNIYFEIFSKNKASLPKNISFENQNFSIIPRKCERLKHSNKLPFII